MRIVMQAGEYECLACGRYFYIAEGEGNVSGKVHCPFGCIGPQSIGKLVGTVKLIKYM